MVAHKRAKKALFLRNMASIEIHSDIAELLQRLSAEQVGRAVLTACAYLQGDEVELPADIDATEHFIAGVLCQKITHARKISQIRKECGKKGGAPKGNNNANKNNQKQAKQAKQANGCFGCFEDEELQKNIAVTDCGTDSCKQKQAKQANGCFGCFEGQKSDTKENEREKRKENEKESNKEKEIRKEEIEKDKEKKEKFVSQILRKSENSKNDDAKYVVNLFGEKEKGCAEKEKETWRESFEVYCNECRSAYSALLNNSEWLAERQRYNPNVDVRLSLEKAVVEFWLTEAGWKNKKQARSKTINWKQTFINALGNKYNRIYQPRQQTKRTAMEDYHNNENYANKTKF